MMQRKRKNGWATLGYVLMVLFFLFWTIGPIVWSFMISITPKSDTMVSPAPLFPANPTWDNYKQLLVGILSPGDASQEARMFKTGMTNSLVSCLLVIVVGSPVCLLAAYALSRLKFHGKKLIHALLLATLVIPLFSVIVPIYKIYSTMGLINNYFGLMLVYISAFMPLTVWLLCSHFESLPIELEEAAKLDGCKPMQILIHILLPISYPVLFAGALIMFISTWNQFLIPLILSPTNSTKPIAVIISEFVTKNTVNYGLMNAGGLLAVIPPVIIAIVFRRFLISGLTSGATKG